jgi:hypothetical protein
MINPAIKPFLFHDEEGEAFACLQIGDHKETWPLRSKVFKNHLASLFHKKNLNIPNAQLIKDTVNVLQSEALFESPTYPVFTRIAEQGQRLYIFLANPKWEVIEIDSNGWRILANAPVFFRKPKGMLELPQPSAGGDINDLRGYLSIINENDWMLLISWLLAAFSPQGPYPILILHGEQGSAKSTISRLLRELVDPSFAPLRSLPRSERDLIIAAKNNWCLAFDNISKLPDWLSDALCRLSTGGGLGSRELYTDSEEAIFNVTRPIILNGIDDLATRGDLVDRSIIINLPRINGESRKLERDIKREFEAAKPKIFGSILNLLSGILAAKDLIKMNSYSRMADFEQWICAAEIGAELKNERLWNPGAFSFVYRQKRKSSSVNCLEAEPLAGLIEKLLDRFPPVWEGCATDLLSMFVRMADVFEMNKSILPNSPNWLVNRLKRVAPNLRDAGIEIVFTDQRPKKIIIRKLSVSQSDATVHSYENCDGV